MEGTKTKYILVALVVIAIIVASIGFYLIKDGAGGITAKEGKIIADEIISSMNEDYLFCGGSGHGYLSNGHFTDWGYSYYLVSKQQSLEVRVYANGENTTEYHELDNETIERITDFEVTQWSIDSPDAIDISSSNDEIRAFLNKYNTEISLMQLTHPDMSWGSVVINTTVWYIHYDALRLFDDPKSAEIYFDANTGEVLYVEADN